MVRAQVRGYVHAMAHGQLWVVRQVQKKCFVQAVQ
jgi:hypothetical protein